MLVACLLSLCSHYHVCHVTLDTAPDELGCPCRAVLVQLGFYFHMKHVLGEPHVVFKWPLIFTIGFMLFFSVVIALFKDIPDVKGDQQASFYCQMQNLYHSGHCVQYVP